MKQCKICGYELKDDSETTLHICEVYDKKAKRLKWYFSDLH